MTDTVSPWRSSRGPNDALVARVGVREKLLLSQADPPISLAPSKVKAVARGRDPGRRHDPLHDGQRAHLDERGVQAGDAVGLLACQELRPGVAGLSGRARAGGRAEALHHQLVGDAVLGQRLVVDLAVEDDLVRTTVGIGDPGPGERARARVVGRLPHGPPVGEVGRAVEAAHPDRERPREVRGHGRDRVVVVRHPGQEERDAVLHRRGAGRRHSDRALRVDVQQARAVCRCNRATSAPRRRRRRTPSCAGLPRASTSRSWSVVPAVGPVMVADVGLDRPDGDRRRIGLLEHAQGSPETASRPPGRARTHTVTRPAWLRTACRDPSIMCASAEKGPVSPFAR